MVTKWDLIYELHADEQRVRQVQEETALGDGVSIAPDALGTKKWWAAIEARSIERRIVEGTVTEARSTSLPDPQEFRMLTSDGSELIGVRHGDPTRYVEGLHLRFEYVTLQRSAAVGVVTPFVLANPPKPTSDEARRAFARRILEVIGRARHS